MINPKWKVVYKLSDAVKDQSQLFDTRELAFEFAKLLQQQRKGEVISIGPVV